VAATDYSKNFRVIWTAHDGKQEELRFDTKEEADGFYLGMLLMGVTDVEKQWYSLTIKEWYRYHNTKPQSANDLWSK
jgi:hypothetical protein